jgi:DNA-binding MarR family transcriptional regulator
MSTPLDARLGPLLGRAHARHHAEVAAVLDALDLSPKGYGALLVLASDGPLTQRELAERQGIDRTTAVAVVDALESSGFVERRRDQDDRRAYALQITRAGRNRLPRATDAIAGVERAALAGLSDSDREVLRRCLNVIAAGSQSSRRDFRPPLS